MISGICTNGGASAFNNWSWQVGSTKRVRKFVPNIW